MRSIDLFFKTLLCAFLTGSLLLGCSDDSLDPEDMGELPEDTTDVDTLPVFDPYADWMQSLLYEFRNQEVTLKHLCMPGSHDAGTYVLQNCTFGANECNTQTQQINTLRQLEEGVRIFDIRPVLKNEVYFTQHTTSCGGLGCKGDRIDNMLNQVAQFLASHNELVILNFGHWCDTGPDDAAFRSLVISLLGELMYTDDGSDTELFIQRPLDDIIPAAGAHGKVLVHFSGIANSPENQALGLFGNAYINEQGSYANAQDYETMKANQFAKYEAYANAPGTTFEISWTLTQNDALAIACANPFGNPTSIADLAATVNPNLPAAIDELVGSGQIVKGRIPNVIWSDFVARDRTEQTLRVCRINLE